MLIFDNDAAGTEAANRALEICLSGPVDIKLASVPSGKDPCDFLLNSGREQFVQLTANAEDVFRFKWDRLMQKFGDDESFAGKKAAIEEFLQTIATAAGGRNLPVIERGLIVNRLSSIIGLDSKQLNAELGRKIARNARATTDNRQRPQVHADMGSGFYAAAQREILEVLLSKPSLFEGVKDQITAETFDVPVLKQIATVLFENLDNDPDVQLSEILAAVESVELGNVIVELAQTGQDKANFESRLDGSLDAIKRYRSQNKKNQISAEEDPAEFLRIVTENTEKTNPHNVGMM